MGETMSLPVPPKRIKHKNIKLFKNNVYSGEKLNKNKYMAYHCY